MSRIVVPNVRPYMAKCVEVGYAEHRQKRQKHESQATMSRASGVAHYVPSTPRNVGARIDWLQCSVNHESNIRCWGSFLPPTLQATLNLKRQTMPELTKEQQILIAMRKTLAAVIKDVTPPPGMKHPLSEQTITDVRQCLGLISAREKELAAAQGRIGERPYYVDEPQSAQVVSIAGFGKGKQRD